MAENVYECMMILDSTRYARDPKDVSGQITTFVNKGGGKMLVSRLWDERRLAFSIARQRKGTYWLSYFRIDSGKVDELKRQCQLSDSILRCMILKIDARIADALVSHAKGSKAAERPKPYGRREVAPPPAVDGKAAEAKAAEAAAS